MSSTKLSVISLNCWGLLLPKPYCQLRKERFHAIGEFLSKGNYDLVLLQEVWVQADYDELCKKVFKVLPHSHYFHSGVFGSGLCVFSKHSILETLQHRYSLNGSPFRFYHGDWYASKCVGLVQVLVNGLRINAYVTHTQADYSPKSHPYRFNRIVQSFELAQFVKLTSDGCDGVIVGGDFNTKPSELGYNLVLADANLLDCWIEQKAEREDDFGHTCNSTDNTFCGGRESKRIDYLLYRANSGCDIRCESCVVSMKRIPGKDYDYSDHFALDARLIIKKNVTAMAPEVKQSALKELYTAAIPQLEDRIAQYHNDRIYFALLCFLSVLALTFMNNLELGYFLDYPLGLVKVFLVLTIGLCLWCGIVVTNKDENELTAVKKDMENQLRCLST